MAQKISMIKVSKDIMNDQNRRGKQWAIGKTLICFCVNVPTYASGEKPIANFIQFKMYRYRIIQNVFYVKDENNVILVFPSKHCRHMFRKFT